MLMLMGCISSLVIAVLQIVGSQNKAGLTFSFLWFIAVGNLAESKLLDIYHHDTHHDESLTQRYLTLYYEIISAQKGSKNDGRISEFASIRVVGRFCSR